MASNTVMKKYVRAEGKDVNNLIVELYYDLGGMNWFTGKSEGRGYYLSVRPVNRQRSEMGYTTESYAMFSGIKQCVKAVQRKSAKAAEQAKIEAEKWEQTLIDYVCEKENITVVS